jgi:hypothetical protein
VLFDFVFCGNEGEVFKLEENNMDNIKKRVDDAIFMIENGRYEGALTLLLTAIDASSRKIYPPGTKSFINPKKEIPNGERFTRFLLVRLHQIFGWLHPEEIYYQPQLPEMVQGEQSPAQIIYKAFRCNDIHEGGVPEEYRYVFDGNVQNQYAMEFKNGEVRFSSGFLKMLIDVITLAPCNGREFGFEHFKLMTEDGFINENYYKVFEERYNLTPGRVNMLIVLAEEAGPAATLLNDDEYAALLSEKVEQNHNGGFKNGLAISKTAQPIFTYEAGITLYGVSIIRDIISGLIFKDLTA